MDESNSQPTRCPCGFFGSPQTLGLCSKCFREREQNRSQAAADMPRQHVSNSLVMVTSSNSSETSSRQLNGDAQKKKCDETQLASSTSGAAGETSKMQRQMPAFCHPQADNAIVSSSATATSVNGTECSCSTEAIDKRLALKRNHSEVSESFGEGSTNSPAKRRRAANPNSNCHFCNCRLELAVQAIGKCKCGCVFCLMHRLPEQHNCTFDHKESGRQEARAKMVPARKHVGTTLKRLDSDS